MYKLISGGGFLNKIIIFSFIIVSFIFIVPFVSSAAPSVEISEQEINAEKDQAYSFTVMVSDEDGDFKEMRIYEDDLLIETVVAGSDGCDSFSCINVFEYSKSEYGDYTYEVVAEDDEGNDDTKQLYVHIKASVPVVVFFNIGASQAGIDDHVEVVLGEPIKFRAQASVSEGSVAEIDVGIDTIECPTEDPCDVSKDEIFSELGEMSYEARAVSEEGIQSVKTDRIKVRVVCPEDNLCCVPGEMSWLQEPRDIEEGCDESHRLMDFLCVDGEFIERSAGKDKDKDGYDAECGDCDDNNSFRNPGQGNLFCDCDEENKPYRPTETNCVDGIDNDCDGKIDCFDPDCPSYDPDNCDIECSSPREKCPGGFCVNLETDVNNCGSCGNVCEPFKNTMMKCIQGECVPDRCMAGFADCDRDKKACEINIMSDRDNCGACGKTCGVSFSCISGKCTKEGNNSVNSLNSTCYHGDSLDCLTEGGCLGKRYCNTTSRDYGECVCIPHVDILSPHKDVYTKRDIEVEVDTNIVLENCTISINSPNKDYIIRERFKYFFLPGQNTVFVECGSYHDSHSFLVDLPEENHTLYDIRRTLMGEPKLKDIPGVDEFKYYKTQNTLGVKHHYINMDNYTNITTRIYAKDHLYDVDAYLQIPSCAGFDAHEIFFENRNLEIIDDYTVLWKISEVNENFDIRYRIPGSIERSCIGLFVPVIIADEIGFRIGVSLKWLFFLLILPLGGIIALFIYRVFRKRMGTNTELENIMSVIEMKRSEGEDDNNIRDEFIQDGIDSRIVDKAFRKMK